MLLSVFLVSLCTQYYQFFLAQAVLQGLSMAFITWPPIAVVSRSLPNHRGLALGVVLGGSSIGGVVWPIMLARLLDHSDLRFGWVLRIVGFVMLPLLAIACFTVREPRQQQNQGLKPQAPTQAESETEAGPRTTSDSTDLPAVDEKKRVQKSDVLALVKNPVFLCLSGGLSIANLGLFVPFFFISSYAIHMGIDTQTAFYLISAINSASLVGRVLPGYLADRFGHYNVCFLATLSSGITAFSLTAANSIGGLFAISIVYGFTSGVRNVCFSYEFVDANYSRPYLGHSSSPSRMRGQDCRYLHAGDSHGAVNGLSGTDVSTYPVAPEIRAVVQEAKCTDNMLTGR